MDALGRLLSAIPAAASSPLALVAYSLAVGAWFVVAWRVRRNRQILSALRLIPRDQRVRLLESEMGVAHLASGLDPEDWLRNRLHVYYLIAFVVASIAIVAVIAIALWNPEKPTTETPPDKISSRTLSNVMAQPVVIYAGSANHGNELDILSYVKLGAARRFIEYHAGPGQIEDRLSIGEHGATVQRVAYTFPKYYLVLMYNSSDIVVEYGVTFLDTSARARIPWNYERKNIGVETFAGACASTICSPAYFDMSARDWVYIETVWYPGDIQDREGFIAFTDYGTRFSGIDDLPAAEALFKTTGTDGNPLTSTERQEITRFRQHTKPNAYGEAFIEDAAAPLQDLVADSLLTKFLGR